MLCELLSYKEIDDVKKGEDNPMKKLLLTPLLTCLLLTACGEFSYKRGASATDLERTRADCRAQNPDSAAVKKCMEAQGWFVQDLNDIDPVAVMTPSENNSPSKSMTHEEMAAATKATMVEAGNKSDPQNSTAPEVKSMLDKFKISSWWKRGVGGVTLENATNQCVAELGEEHRPDPVTQYTTRGLLICMRKSGWYGLASK
ncbi:hypothetical protein [Methylovorus sp. MP688]|jgi:hypothetical protein|uniref:hypothetical protein n=1 Tax=Methylovorus sp. (strain MP688) TaxID=887061 RepID=UPI0001EC452B|nr:hypothetical protein [Methylovorus sp. MP688]ADQ83902.1 conserved hypothetical protein [Methylovorus sp. MP688]